MTSDDFRLVALHLHPGAGGALQRLVEAAEAPATPPREAMAPAPPCDDSLVTTALEVLGGEVQEGNTGPEGGEAAGPESTPMEVEPSPLHPSQVLLVQLLKREWHEKVCLRN